MNNITSVFGLIGFPLEHSFSKKYFTEKISSLKIIDTEYQLFPIESLSEFKSILLNNANLKGLNVTLPYKVSIIPYLNELEETASAVGAVNTIKIVKNSDHSNHLIGYNTDVYGFKQSIKPFLEINHEKALILGRGGAAKAVSWVLNQMGICCNYVSRNPVKSDEISYNDLNEWVIKSHLLIINTTPVGNFPNINDFPSIPYEFLTENHLLYDLTYNPVETAFLKKGKLAGSQIINGQSMLEIQAEKSWEIWNS